MFSADKNVSAMGLCRKVLKICTLLALEKDLLYFQSIYNLHIDFVKIVAFLLIIADRLDLDTSIINVLTISIYPSA